MKQLIVGLVLFAGFYSCSKKCESINPTCEETPPALANCQSQFERWFYSYKTTECVLIAYTGCSEYGFDTKVECDECECN